VVHLQTVSVFVSIDLSPSADLVDFLPEQGTPFVNKEKEVNYLSDRIGIVDSSYTERITLAGIRPLAM
jgi:hypothetical protein